MNAPCPKWQVPPYAVQVERVSSLLTGDPEVNDALNSRVGVSDGSVAAPGVIGEVVMLQASATIPAFSLSPPYNTILPVGTLGPGEWMLWPSAYWQRSYPAVFFSLPPTPGITGSLNGGFFGAASTTSTLAVGVPGHASRAASIGLVFDVNVNPGAGVFTQGNFTLQVQAQRIR